MKKICSVLIFSFLSISQSFANDVLLEDVNNQFESILQPFQNSQTKAQIQFNDMAFDAEKAKKISLKAYFEKKGKSDNIILSVNHLSYDHTILDKPLTAVDGSFGINISKLLEQEKLNQVIPLLKDMFDKFSDEYAKNIYGDAMDINAVITSLHQDSERNYVGLAALITANIDLQNLPEHTKLNEVMFKSASVALEFDVHRGLHFQAFLVSNPQYERFDATKSGLKEKLEKLASGDHQVIRDIKEIFERIDSEVSTFIENHQY